MTILRHIAFIAVALIVTFVLFEFWGRFGSEMTHVTKLEASAPAPSVQPQPQEQPVQQTPGEVTMSIVPPKPNCTKKHPCPK
ncbi:MAG TPA: hypothetical protein VG309_06095 [Rhizomicrobium sp.]|jgi:hypothetical protein|nr:hypothetical protein [Rhizomicrobium sp.]